MFDKIISEETRNNIAKRRENNIKTLFGLPYKQDIDGEDFVVLGVPYDTSVTNRTGCRFGPRAIRNAYGAGRLSYEQDNSYKVANLKGMDMGEHGGDPTSVEFCNKIGLDYVSCSPFRVPIARLAAAQAAIAQKK